MKAGMPSKIRFAAPGFSASAPRRFSFKAFCNAVAAFCNGEFLRIKNQAANRAGSPLLLSTKDSVSGFRRAAIWTSHAAPVLGIFRNAKSGVHPHASVPGTEHDGTQRCTAHPSRRVLRRENHPQTWAICMLDCSIMKKLFVRLSLALLALIGLAFMAGVIHPVTAAVAVLAVQAVAFSVAAPQARFYLSALTPEQVEEFSEILDGLKQYKDVFPQLKGNITTVAELQRAVDGLRRVSLGGASSGLVRRADGTYEVSERCARWIGGIHLATAIRSGNLSGRVLERAENIMRSAMSDIEVKTALSSSDIPLPVGYSGEVAELVGMYGVARKFATVFPLGDGVVKLPRLKTDPTFGLIAGSGPVTEKSPQTEWVTFTAEKFGGLIRMPSEIDEDSIVAMGQFLARYAARQMAYVEDHQVFRSTGAGSGLNGSAEGLTKNVATNSKTTTSTGLGSPSEFTLTHFRTLRTVCDGAALRNGAYYLNPTFEGLLASFNTSGNRPYNPNAQIQGTGSQPFIVGPTLDGFPIRWIDIMPAYSTSDVLSTVHVLFGDASFQYLGVRGGMRFDTSKEAGFTTDEVLVRALERMTTGLMATGAMGGLITAAA